MNWKQKIVCGGVIVFFYCSANNAPWQLRDVELIGDPDTSVVYAPVWDPPVVTGDRYRITLRTESVFLEWGLIAIVGGILVAMLKSSKGKT